jgi:hypothetical protein
MKNRSNVIILYYKGNKDELYLYKLNTSSQGPFLQILVLFCPVVLEEIIETYQF